MGKTSPHATRRAEALSAWDRPVTAVRYVDPERARLLERLDVRTVEDLLRHYPFRYLDLTEIRPLAQLVPGEATAVGDVHDVRLKRPRPRLSIVEVAISDGTGVLIGVWFNQPYMAERFKVGERVALAGAVEIDDGLRRIRNPFVEKLGESRAKGRVVPVHRATEQLSTGWVRRLVLEALDAYGDVFDPLPVALRLEHRLPPLAHALHAVHFPRSMAEAEDARRRLAYDEALTLQAGLAMRRHAAADDRRGVVHEVRGPSLAALRSSLPFALTGDQERAVREVLRDMARDRPMNRMLLGDVGTGKTVVAAHALCAAHDSGGQGAMMAPTEVLAAQYASKVGPLLDAAGVSWALLTGSTRAAASRRSLAALADGSLSVVFGTHSLVQERVAFRRLTLAVVDEQHRFGVEQRIALRAKGETADMLVMTATPIPRSLALTAYGDLDVSTLRERPPTQAGAVRTTVAGKRDRREAYAAVRAAVAEGRRAYVVCPLVEESDAAEARAAQREAERLRDKVFPDLKVGLLTGRTKSAEKTEVMEAFRRGDIGVLVSTSVIEVGVDVPEATVMIVEDAERFGLAQLHQLRGRIARGPVPGQIFLFAEPRTEEGRRRMEAVASTDDGFALAEEDLRLRGEGQLLGERQHGLPESRLLSLARDLPLIETARRDAARLVAEDPHLSSAAARPLGREVRRRFEEAWRWASSG